MTGQLQKVGPKFLAHFVKTTGDGEQFTVTFNAENTNELAARLKDAGDVATKRLLMNNDKVERATDQVKRIQQEALAAIRTEREALAAEREAFRAERDAAAAGNGAGAGNGSGTVATEADGAAAAS